MSFAERLDHLHARARANTWFQHFADFIRIGLAWGFLPSGFVKIMGERFTSLANEHPMGAYLESLHHTGFYYPFIGVMQMVAAILLLFRRTATLGAVLYFPIILNICLLSIAVRFEGSLVSSPLMVLANLYLLCWDYHKLKYIFPFNHKRAKQMLPIAALGKFPTVFVGSSVAFVVVLVLFLTQGFDIMPRNSKKDCLQQCDDSKNPAACITFCDCIHQQGKPLETCLEEYNKALKK